MPHTHQDPASQACAFLVKRLQESLNQRKDQQLTMLTTVGHSFSNKKNVTVKLPCHQAEAPLRHFQRVFSVSLLSKYGQLGSLNILLKSST